MHVQGLKHVGDAAVGGAGEAQRHGLVLEAHVLIADLLGQHLGAVQQRGDLPRALVHAHGEPLAGNEHAVVGLGDGRLPVGRGGEHLLAGVGDGLYTLGEHLQPERRGGDQLHAHARGGATVGIRKEPCTGSIGFISRHAGDHVLFTLAGVMAVAHLHLQRVAVRHETIAFFAVVVHLDHAQSSLVFL